MGGEKRLLLGAGCKRLGSPPRGRGKEYAPMCQRTAMRITPAWAGKRYADLKIVQMNQDHPRVGGEKAGTGDFDIVANGSPPRGQGKGTNSNRTGRTAGITPA